MSRATTPSVLHVAARAQPLERDFDALYDAHFDFVYRCLRRLGVAAANVEDAAQDVFVVLHRRLCDLRPEASERAFLFAIASRVAREHRRRQLRTSTLPLHEETPSPQPGPSPFEEAANAQAALRLELFLRTLDEEQRVVFMLMELEELSAKEVSEALAVKLNTVYSRLRLARERFVRFVRVQEGAR